MTPLEIVLLVVAIVAILLAIFALTKSFSTAGIDSTGVTLKNNVQGYNPSVLNFYEEFQWNNINFQDNYKNPVTGTMNFNLYRIGRIVIMHANTANTNVTIAAASPGQSISSTMPFPSRFRSPFAVVNPVLIGNAGIRTVSRCDISTDGTVTFRADPALTGAWAGNNQAPTFVNAATFCWTV